VEVNDIFHDCPTQHLDMITMSVFARIITASSRCPAPSGNVPGDEAVDCGAKIRFGGEGAGPDGVFLVRSSVFWEKSVDLFAFSYFLRVLDVTCKSTDDMI
jgi:hypothetical protein